MKNNAFKLNSENAKQAIGIWKTITFEIKIKEEIFFEKYDYFFSYRFLYFETLLEWECVFVYQDLRTEKKAFTANSENKSQETGIQLIFIFEMKLQK